MNEMTTGNPFVSNLSHEPFEEACKADETRTARLNALHVCYSGKTNKFSEENQNLARM